MKVCLLEKACYMFLEAGSQREVFISLLFELIVQVTVLWRRKEEEGGGGRKGRGMGREKE